jgi:hypothetical protein
MPIEFMRKMSGFQTPGSYFLPRASQTPDNELLAQIFPFIECWEERFRQKAQKKKFADGGMDEADMAAVGFLELLKELRVILLQDLAVLQPRKYTKFHSPVLFLLPYQTDPGARVSGLAPL